MIILDTNVLSEMVRPQPNPGVLTWMDSLDISETAITAITVAELLYGVGKLPEGRRKSALKKQVQTIFAQDFEDRIHAFDDAAAYHYASIVSGREAIGRPIDTPDAQIAAICAENGATLATRNTKDFEETGITLINPWDLDST